jgi:hypothetical protein
MEKRSSQKSRWHLLPQSQKYVFFPNTAIFNKNILPLGSTRELNFSFPCGVIWTKSSLSKVMGAFIKTSRFLSDSKAKASFLG